MNMHTNDKSVIITLKVASSVLLECMCARRGGGKSRRWPSPRKIPKQFFYMWPIVGSLFFPYERPFLRVGCLFSPIVGPFHLCGSYFSPYGRLFHHVKVFSPYRGHFWGGSPPPLQTFLQAPMLECMTIEIEISFYSE